MVFNLKPDSKSTPVFILLGHLCPEQIFIYLLYMTLKPVVNAKMVKENTVIVVVFAEATFFVIECNIIDFLAPLMLSVPCQNRKHEKLNF